MKKPIVAAACLGVAAALSISTPASADPKGEPIPITCEGGATYWVTVNGNGAFTPGHDVDDTAMLIPTSFGDFHGVITDSTGAVIDEFTDPATERGRPTKPRRDIGAAHLRHRRALRRPGSRAAHLHRHWHSGWVRDAHALTCRTRRSALRPTAPTLRPPSARSGRRSRRMIRRVSTTRRSATTTRTARAVLVSGGVDADGSDHYPEERPVRPQSRSPTLVWSTSTRSPTRSSGASSRQPGTSPSPRPPADPATSRVPTRRLWCRARWSSRPRPARCRSTTGPGGGAGCPGRLAAPGGARQHPGRPRRHPVVHVGFEDAAPTPRGPASGCRPRPSGSTPPAAGLGQRPSPGATTRSPAARRWPTRWHGRFPWENLDPQGRDRHLSPVGQFPPNGYRPPTTSPATSGSGQRSRGPRRDHGRGAGRPAVRPGSGASAAQRTAPPGHQGRLAPVRAVVLPAVPPRRPPRAGGPSTTGHLGFRCVRDA